MMATQARQTTRPTPTWADAEAALRSRPDLPSRAVSNAKAVGPAAVVALARNHPTPEELTAEEQRQDNEKRLLEGRRVAKQALHVQRCLDGEWASVRLDVYAKVSEFRTEIALLADWSKRETAGAEVPTQGPEWLKIRRAFETLTVREAILQGYKLTHGAEIEQNRPRRRR